MLLAVPLVFAGSAPARGSCPLAVVVDGYVLIARPTVARLPPATGDVEAIAPACNDAGQEEPDTRTTVTRLEGVPPEVAVLDERDLYLNAGAQTRLRGHPLEALPVPASAPLRRCRPAPAFRGTVQTVGNTGVTLRAGGGDRGYAIGAGARFANVPVTMPIREGQRLEIAGERCAGGAFRARRVTFLEPVLSQGAYRNPFGVEGDGLPWWAVALIALVGGALAVYAGRRVSARVGREIR